MSDPSVSLNKFVSATGICSRREADRWIDAGRLTINGTPAIKGNRVEPGDQVLLDGEAIGDRPSPVYLAFHKPAGVTSTTDPNDRDNIVDFIDFPERIFTVGRLDKASTGLLLMTNDGDIVNEVLRAEHGHEKEYLVSVDHPLTDDFLRRMSAGVPILDQVTKACTVEQLDVRLFRIVLIQGLNRQIRRMCDHFNYRVTALKRIRIMHIGLGDLPVGKYRHLTKEEIADLKQ